MPGIFRVFPKQIPVLWVVYVVYTKGSKIKGGIHIPIFHNPYNEG